MKDATEEQLNCTHCGRASVAPEEVCPACGHAATTMDDSSPDRLEWVRIRDSLKLKWIASVLAFWVSAAVLVAVMFINSKVDLTLTSIALGMLVIGIWLKTRYRLHLRKEPEKL